MDKMVALEESFKDSSPGPTQQYSAFKLIWRYFKEAFGIKSVPALDFPFSQQEIERYHHYNKDASSVDSQTASDLELDYYAEYFFKGMSITGQQILNSRLRIVASDTEVACEREILESLISQGDTGIDNIAEKCLPLRQAQAEVTQLLYEDTSFLRPFWAEYIWLIQVLAISSFLLTAFSWYFIVPFIGILLITIFLQAKSYPLISEFEPQADALAAMINVQRNLVQLRKRTDGNFGEYFLSEPSSLATIKSFLEKSIISKFFLFLSDYADWFFLKNVSKYYSARRMILLHSDELKQLHKEIGGLELKLALVRHLSNSKFCWVDRSSSTTVRFSNMVSPFIIPAMPLTIDFGASNIFLTGQNGVGKSTLIRTLGLNIILARSFGFAYAQSARLEALPIMSSIRINDSWRNGDSLYMAELKRGREMLNASDLFGPCYFLIDEIFRGTNHLDSVSAASSVLNKLGNSGRVIVSSHNLILGALLQAKFTSLKLVRPLENSGFLSLTPGVLKETNGISLLEKYIPDPEIRFDANEIYKWLVDYLTYPANVPPLS